jgi:N-dimethylarginine dimethylaminohydrolase
MPRAFTRAVSRRIAECQLTHLQRVPIDAVKAAAQHAAYENALATAGFKIVRLPELPARPRASARRPPQPAGWPDISNSITSGMVSSMAGT